MEGDLRLKPAELSALLIQSVLLFGLVFCAIVLLGSRFSRDWIQVPRFVWNGVGFGLSGLVLRVPLNLYARSRGLRETSLIAYVAVSVGIGVGAVGLGWALEWFGMRG